ncbi:hypothetical protein SARC_06530 [Sphaeroforma arctica JP610]|uniref:Uncharacterized protein n=1 Tax=Sphaeroforma arctica JP610 TaxID=667725 RepID=A0A0L0FX66_9EUKA|nr:hypothetical protein SARC_06530 [Sphaeroforma arctica JP610]KNC81131.1 hypothetical protein SARC_06530 [Sphaeroforma arctica JP610]|eukprot:XP_014155033.1 hypothetical protein SARC_06530 [Sphaeroforma arctica JP610]
MKSVPKRNTKPKASSSSLDQKTKHPGTDDIMSNESSASTRHRMVEKADQPMKQTAESDTKRNPRKAKSAQYEIPPYDKKQMSLSRTAQRSEGHSDSMVKPALDTMKSKSTLETENSTPAKEMRTPTGTKKDEVSLVPWGIDMSGMLNDFRDIWASPSEFIVENLMVGKGTSAIESDEDEGAGSSKDKRESRQLVTKQALTTPIKRLGRDSVLLEREKKAMPWDGIESDSEMDGVESGGQISGQYQPTQVNKDGDDSYSTNGSTRPRSSKEYSRLKKTAKDHIDGNDSEVGKEETYRIRDGGLLSAEQGENVYTHGLKQESASDLSGMNTFMNGLYMVSKYILDDEDDSSNGLPRHDTHALKRERVRSTDESSSVVNSKQPLGKRSGSIHTVGVEKSVSEGFDPLGATVAGPSTELPSSSSNYDGLSTWRNRVKTTSKSCETEADGDQLDSNPRATGQSAWAKRQAQKHGADSSGARRATRTTSRSSEKKVGPRIGGNTDRRGLHNEQLAQKNMESDVGFYDQVRLRPDIERKKPKENGTKGVLVQQPEHAQIQTFMLENVYRGDGIKPRRTGEVIGTKRGREIYTEVAARRGGGHATKPGTNTVSVGVDDRESESESESGSNRDEDRQDQGSVVQVVGALASILSPIDWFA